MTLYISSSVFEEGDKIPAKYTCDGDNISPSLAWGDMPEATNSLALIVDDPDAPFGTWTHWVLYNLPANINGLPEAVPMTDQLENGGMQGRNDFGQIGYGGPCPPGSGHHYHFTLYALSKVLDVASGASKSQVLDAMQGNIIEQAHLIGIYR